MTNLPTVGRIVHYVSHGSADGTYPSICRAAVVAEVPREIEGYHGEGFEPNEEHVNLCVLNPTGIFFGQSAHAEPVVRWPSNAVAYKGGTWHWPCVKADESQVDPTHGVSDLQEQVRGLRVWAIPAGFAGGPENSLEVVPMLKAEDVYRLLGMGKP